MVSSGRQLVGRTLVISLEGELPWRLYELLREVSAFVVVGRVWAPPFENVDHVVVWDGAHVEVDQRRLLWPEDADLVRLLLSESTSSALS